MTAKSDVDKIARLARIKIKEEEKQPFTDQLTSIMEMIDQMQEVDCSDVEPLRSVVGTVQHLRQDKAENNNIAQDLFRNAPGKQANLARDIQCYVVPKVVE